MSWHRIVYLVLAVGICWGVLALTQRRGGGQGAAAAVGREEQSAAEPRDRAEREWMLRRLQALEQRVSEQQRLLEKQALASQPAAKGASAAEVREEPASLEDAQRTEQREVALTIAHYEGILAREERSTSLAEPHEAALRAYISPLATIERLDCRQTLCRLELRYIDSISRRDVTRLWGRGPTRSGAFFTPNADKTGITVYVGMPGVPFPMADLQAAAALQAPP